MQISGPILEVGKEKKPHCVGQIFRACASQFSTNYSGEVSICFRVQMRRLKTYSCSGCDKCGWIFDYLSEVNDDDFPVEGIEEVEDGKAYLLEGVFSPGDYYEGGYSEFDGFRLIEWKEEFRTQGRIAFEKGKQPSACPHKKGLVKEGEWMEGYINADAQEAGEN